MIYDNWIPPRTSGVGIKRGHTHENQPRGAHSQLSDSMKGLLSILLLSLLDAKQTEPNVSHVERDADVLRRHHRDPNASTKLT